MNPPTKNSTTDSDIQKSKITSIKAPASGVILILVLSALLITPLLAERRVLATGRSSTYSRATAPPVFYSTATDDSASARRGNIPVAGSSQGSSESELAICQFELSASVKQSHTKYYLSYSFEVNEHGRPEKVTKFWDDEVGKEKVAECIGRWRFRGVPNHSRMVMFLRWERGLGWNMLSVTGADFKQIVRVTGDSSNVGAESGQSVRTTEMPGNATTGDSGISSAVVFELPKVVSKAMPAYPAIAAAQRIYGRIPVDVEIDSNGAVTEAQGTSGHTILKKVSREAAQRWKFNPVNAEISVRSTTLVFNFLEIPLLKPVVPITDPYEVAIAWIATPFETSSAANSSENLKGMQLDGGAVASGRPLLASHLGTGGEVVGNISERPQVRLTPAPTRAGGNSVNDTGLRSSSSGRRKPRPAMMAVSKTQQVPASFSYPESPEIVTVETPFEAAAVAGRVSDSTGAGLEKALVERMGSEWKKRIDATFTNSEGLFSFPQSSSQTEYLQISKPGFNTLQVKVKINENQKTPLNISLGSSQ